MFKRNAILASVLAGCVAGAAAQGLNGLEVHGVFSLSSLALPGVLDEVRTIGPGVEFRYDGNRGAFAFADFTDTTLTIGFFNSEFQFLDDGTAWDFNLTGDQRFTTFTPISDNFPRPLTFSGVNSDGVASFGQLPWHDPVAPNTMFTATYRVALSDVAQPIPEPSTYALMLAGLALVGGVAGRRCRRT